MQQQHTEYYRTLRVYLEENLNATQTARELYIHRSTLLYRLERIREILDSDLTDPDELLYLNFPSVCWNRRSRKIPDRKKQSKSLCGIFYSRHRKALVLKYASDLHWSVIGREIYAYLSDRFYYFHVSAGRASRSDSLWINHGDVSDADLYHCDYR